jgi:hypothetical protein
VSVDKIRSSPTRPVWNFSTSSNWVLLPSSGADWKTDYCSATRTHLLQYSLGLVIQLQAPSVVNQNHYKWYIIHMSVMHQLNLPAEYRRVVCALTKRDTVVLMFTAHVQQHEGSGRLSRKRQVRFPKQSVFVDFLLYVYQPCFSKVWLYNHI